MAPRPKRREPAAAVAHGGPDDDLEARGLAPVLERCVHDVAVDEDRVTRPELGFDALDVLRDAPLPDDDERLLPGWGWRL